LLTKITWPDHSTAIYFSLCGPYLSSKHPLVYISFDRKLTTIFGLLIDPATEDELRRKQLPDLYLLVHSGFIE
jgi:hypothetical protein